MGKFTKLAAMIAIVVIGVLCGVNNAQAATPSNSNATKEVREVLNYLESISGNQIISGQQDKLSAPSQTYNRVYEITGKYPGIAGGDFGFTSSGNDTIYNREELVNQAIQKWNEGSIPTWSWHMVRPDKSEPNTWTESILCNSMNNYEFQQMTTEGTSYYQCFINRIDSVVWAFQKLKDAGVPVLWRPFHEMNGNWFWWGGNPTYSPKLYKIMYDRYTNYWGLDNIIWVWNVDRPTNGEISQYYPGDQYVDVLSMDIYNRDFNYNYYQAMLNLCHGKPIAIGEVGELPPVNILWEQPKWTYFMCWTEYLEGNNTHSVIQDLYWQEKVITRDKLHMEQIDEEEEYYIKDSQNKVICADNYGYDSLIANRDSCGGAWETFSIIRNADGTISLKSKINNKYVCAVLDEDSRLVARSDKIGTWEKFYLGKTWDGKFTLKTLANGKYVCADRNHGSVLYADRDSVGEWETFTIYTIFGVSMQ